jgi:hypothetical protein
MVMETFSLTLESRNEIIIYRDDNHLVKYEYGILEELISAIERGDMKTLVWFAGFGDRIRSITMNVHAYRKGLEFGFNEIAFDQYGWFKRPLFLDKEDLIFGNPHHYGEHSILHLGRGANHIWTYALNYNYGTAGGGSALSVYDKQFKSRDEALYTGLNVLKVMMTSKLGDKDITNFKQPVIISTLKDIAKAELNRVQLSLF